MEKQITAITIPDWQDAELDIANNWDKYLGFIWANIFIKCNLPKNGIVVEIAPGVAEKVGRGLEAFGFKGTLYIVEPEEFTLNEITKKYKEHIPGCTVIPIQKTLEECPAFIPEKVDAIIANHPLDDMILGNSLQQEQFKDYFGDKFGTSIEKTKLFWNKLEAEKEYLEKLKKDIISSWQNLIKHSQPSFVALSQYKSYYFAKNKIFAPDKNALDILKRLRTIYAKFENKNIIPAIKAFNADLEHWMILESPK